jgi:hypothetical protein
VACSIVHVCVKAIGLDCAALSLHSHNTATEKFKDQGMDGEHHGRPRLVDTTAKHRRVVLSKDCLDYVTGVQQLLPFNAYQDRGTHHQLITLQSIEKIAMSKMRGDINRVLGGEPAHIAGWRG